MAFATRTAKPNPTTMPATAHETARSNSTSPHTRELTATTWEHGPTFAVPREENAPDRRPAAGLSTPAELEGTARSLTGNGEAEGGAMFRIATSNAAVQNIDGVSRTDGSHAHLHLACRSHSACDDWLRLLADFLAFAHGGLCERQDHLAARNPPQLQGYERPSGARLNERLLAHSTGARRWP
jgi:hypothetical protein